MPIKLLIPTVNCHDLILIDDDKRQMKKWDSYRTISLIEEGMNDILGNESCKLIMKTLKLIYKIDEVEIARDPSRFEEKLIKVLGPDASEKVLDSIAKRFRKDILQS